MLYTIGKGKLYHALVEVQGPQKKLGRLDAPPEMNYDGGGVFQTVEDAERYIQKYCIGEEEKYAVFGLADTVWGVDTVPSKDGWWHYLLWNRPIVMPEEIEELATSK